MNHFLINLLLTALVVSYFAFAQATFAYFLEFTFREGAIFHGWRRFLDQYLYDSFWYKPLGGCAVCMNVWLGYAPAFVTAMQVGQTTADSALWWLIYLVLSSYFLRKMLD